MFNLTFAHFIRNRFIASSSGRQFEKRSPVDGSLVGMIPEGGAPEIDAAVEAAQAALQGPWRRMSLSQRVAMLEAVAAEIDRRADDFIDAEVQDTGKPRALASHLDIPRGAANFRVFADVVKNVPCESF
jgi:aminomuconate-semialdehyde/2-hydroxymuconate-6-semialdehyde dehydrogenase